MRDLWVYIEYTGEKIQRCSQEALSEGVREAAKANARCTAVVLGQNIAEPVLASIKDFGVDRILRCQDQLLSQYSTLRYTACLEHLVREQSPDILLMGSSAMTRDLAPRLSGRLYCGLITEATFLHAQPDGFHVTRSAYRPHASMIMSFEKPGFAIITLAAKVMEIERSGAIHNCAVESAQGVRKMLSLRSDQVRIEHSVRELSSSVQLADAEVIVAGGKGMQAAENFLLLEELADLLGGTVAATRIAVDMKWRPRESMVGVSGHVVSPNLYIACGISGAIQHLMGMQSSETIIAINNDPHAPIFRIATLGILGDVRDVLPLMIDAFRKAAPAASRGYPKL